ncbi:MAG: thiamine phosphate synthase [Acidobacteriota bacterium]
MLRCPIRMLIYVVTDRRARADLSAASLVSAVTCSGADMIQIREKDLPDGQLLDLARRAVAMGRAEVFVNGRADIALAAGASGVHLPADGVPVEAVKSTWPGRLRVGVSTHSLRQARRAADGGADFITFGPVFETESKKAYGPPVGVEALEAVVREVAVPVFAIGGILPARLGLISHVPLTGVAMISAVVGARDMGEAVSTIRAAMRR